ncbi:hypothetical protein MXB_1894, partial [Myxobolus squamalis]
MHSSEAKNVLNEIYSVCLEGKCKRAAKIIQKLTNNSCIVIPNAKSFFRRRFKTKIVSKCKIESKQFNNLSSESEFEDGPYQFVPPLTNQNSKTFPLKTTPTKIMKPKNSTSSIKPKVIKLKNLKSNPTICMQQLATKTQNIDCSSPEESSLDGSLVVSTAVKPEMCALKATQKIKKNLVPESSHKNHKHIPKATSKSTSEDSSSDSTS